MYPSYNYDQNRETQNLFLLILLVLLGILLGVLMNIVDFFCGFLYVSWFNLNL